MGDGRDRRDRERERDRERHRDRRDRSHSRSRSSSHAKKSHKNRDRSRDRSERNRSDRNDRYYEQDDQRRSAEGGAYKRDRDRKSKKSSDVIQVSSDEDDGVQVVDKSEDSSSKLEIPEELDSDEEAALIEKRRKDRQKLLEKLSKNDTKKSHNSKFEKISASTEIQDDREDENDDLFTTGAQAEPQKPTFQVRVSFFLIFGLRKVSTFSIFSGATRMEDTQIRCQKRPF